LNKKAVALMSGGLDSNLAVRLLHDMGIEIVGAHFTGPFCQCNRGKGGCTSFASDLARELGISFKTIPLGQDYIDIVEHPPHGYGSGVNPCIDCRILMLRKAKELMHQVNASFVVTGEVLGQRPMSQLADKLKIIERESGLEGLIVRPLSGKHMPETTPEKEGVIDRDKLLAIRGRSRREQMDLAAFLKIGDYPCPAGGCLLTDKHFAALVRDTIYHGGLKLGDIALLRVGRHFRLPGGSKLVVGRNKEENGRIERLVRANDTLLVPENVMGPSALVRGDEVSVRDLRLAAEIVAAYSSGAGDVTIACKVQDRSDRFECNRTDRTHYAALRV
jgi:tRNA-specific 2-thiouridylase